MPVAVPSKKLVTKSSIGSKVSHKSKKCEDTTTSAHIRLALELRPVEEQQRIREEELAAENELQDLERKLEEELANKARRITDAKATLKKKMEVKHEYRKQQMVIRKQSEEDAVKFIRQASELGSGRASSIGTDSGPKALCFNQALQYHLIT